jgi:hypothetical protein
MVLADDERAVECSDKALQRGSREAFELAARRGGVEHPVVGTMLPYEAIPAQMEH